MDDRVKDLLEKVRGTASLAADVAADTARYAGIKAGQMMDVAKLNVQLFDLNSEFDGLLKQLGRVMYDTHRGENPNVDVTLLLERADETAKRVEEVRQRAALLRHSKDCPVCGAACAREDAFCRGCGTPLD